MSVKSLLTNPGTQLELRLNQEEKQPHNTPKKTHKNNATELSYYD